MRTAYDVIIRPIITEQSMEDLDIKKYTFEVAKDAGKIEIKKAIEEIFDVKVIKVTTTTIRAKEKRVGANPSGMTATGKKAVVKLSADSKNIEIATEILYGIAEVRDALDAGMTLLYTGDMQEVDGRECFIFALGTEHSEQFVCEQFYAVCDNLVYAYDALNDSWSVVSFG